MKDKCIVNHKHSLPNEWLLCRNKDLFYEVTERSQDGLEQLLSVSEHDGVTPRLLEMKPGDFVTRAQSLVDYKRCQKDDIVMNIMLAWRKGLGVSDYNGIVSPAYAVFRPKPGVCSRYFHFLFRTSHYAGLFKRNSRGIIDSRLRLYPARFLSLSSLVPPYSEQQKIVAYLDAKTKILAKKKSSLQHQVQLFRELQQSLIESCVFGRDNNSLFSGFSKEKWKIQRNKDLFYEISERSQDGLEQLLSVSEHDGVTPRLLEMKPGDFVTRAQSLVDYKRCQKDDIVMNIMLAWRKGLGVSDYNGIVSPAYAVFRPKPGVCSRYFHFLFRTSHYAGLFKRNSRGIIDSRLRLYPARFLSLSSLVPPYSEQQKIVAYLDKKNHYIREKIKRLRSLCSVLCELEESIIFDVVTGKRRIDDPSLGS